MQNAENAGPQIVTINTVHIFAIKVFDTNMGKLQKEMKVKQNKKYATKTLKKVTIKKIFF